MSAPQYAREIPHRYRLEGARCTGCHKVFLPARPTCPACHGQAFEAIALPREGKIVTWTVIHAPPSAFASGGPYAVAIVDLGELRVTAPIVDCEPGELAVGTGVRAVFRRLWADGDGGLLHYGYKFTLIR